ncbi:MAG: dTDP-4-dehydrorhamnose reductase [Eubacteriales bacterium]|nr:dTDP-4-dehydrorhamnose reductase [Eubacteriales bacterium]
MRVFVTGVKGQLGHDIMLELAKRNIEGIGVDIEEMDITDPEAVRRVINEAGIQAVIHCAAWTAVDAAEDNVDKCRAVNAYGTENIAKVCGELNIPMMYFSTDYVFNGQGENFWKPDDKAEPLNLYGLTKYEGEEAVRKYVPDKHFIVRIQWVYGLNGKNFVKTMLKLSETHDSLTVVADQVGSPSYTPDLARIAVDMIETDRYGTYHAANTGICSWYEFAEEIFKLAGRNVKVTPVSSDQYPTKAKRPNNSRMDLSKLRENGFEELPKWQDALYRYLQELGELG